MVGQLNSCLFLFLQLIVQCSGISSPSPSPSFSFSSSVASANTNAENVAAAVLMPGYLTGADELKSLEASLIKQGLPTVTVPMPNWHWLSVLGGRSVRPILERIDFTVQHLIAQLNEEEEAYRSSKTFPSFEYSLLDAWLDFQENPGGFAEVGGSWLPLEYPKNIVPKGNFPLPDLTKPANKKKKIALIGHSAGGWISRIYLSEQEYGGKVYNGSNYVHSLVTLGTPHASAPGPAFAGISWINEQEEHLQQQLQQHLQLQLELQEQVQHTGKRSGKTRTLAVAGKGYSGDQWGFMTKGAYSFCCPDGSDGSQYDGDGMTPIFSSLAMPNSESLILPQDRVNHFGWTDAGWVGKQVAPELFEDMETNGSPWYGSDEVVAEWLPWILEGVTTPTNTNLHP